MSRRNRGFLALLLLYLGLVAFALHHVISGVDPRYRESAEESLVETAALLATLIEQDLHQGEINTTRVQTLFDQLGQHVVAANIFGVQKTRVELRCYVTDAQGKVLFDSLGHAQGEDFSQWRDVYLALRGQYGSRTSQSSLDRSGTSVMFVASALRDKGQIVGVVSVGKPISSFERFATIARRNIVSIGLLAAGAALALALLLSVWMIKPFGLISDILRHVHQARRQRAFSWRRLGHRTAQGLHQSFADIRAALSGRDAVAEHVQTLTHEIKSPLSAIRAAAELLREPLPEPQHHRFVNHILQGAHRIQETVDRLMELTTLQSRHSLDQAQQLDLCDITQQVVDASLAQAKMRAVVLRVELETPQAWIFGDAYLLRRALANLVDNALDFSPEGQTVTVRVRALNDSGTSNACVRVQDLGPGVPDFALSRVFERYYSLPRPNGGKKSTGLGLPFVQTVAKLHGGTCGLSPGDGGGCVATLSVPLLSLTKPSSA